MEAAIVPGAAAARFDSRRFHLWMAGAFLIVAFGGFTPTYWAKVASGTLHVPPIVHIHGFLLFTWTLLYFLQTALVASGRTPAHRAWGTAGIALFSVLICSIIATRITVMKLDDARGFGDEARRFSAVAFGALPFMIGLFGFAIAHVRRPEIHKRLMFVLMAGMMTPAAARVFITLFAPPGALDGAPPPPFVSVPPAIIGLILLAIAMVYDWRTRGRPHKVYLYGAVLLVIQPVLAALFANTSLWMQMARSLEGLAG